MTHAQHARRIVRVTLLLLVLGGGMPLQAQQVQVDTQQGKVGETVTFTVSLHQAVKPIDALGLILTYDPQVLRYTGTFTKGQLVQGFDFFNAHERQPGHIRVGGFTTKQAITTGQHGSLISLAFTVVKANHSTVQIARMVDDLAGLHTVSGTFTSH
jgi:hypothetical protein